MDTPQAPFLIGFGKHLQRIAHRIVGFRGIHGIEYGAQKRVKPVTIAVDFRREGLNELRAADGRIVTVEAIEGMERFDEIGQAAFKQRLRIR